MLELLAWARLVPYDAAIDTPLGHRNLVLIYAVVWLVQMGYGAYVLHTWRASRRRGKGE